MENLRKIKFTLEGHGILGYEKPGFFDYDKEKEHDDAVKVRRGMFHAFGTDIHHVENQYLPISCAIVEDEDGKVYKINPENVTFIKD